MSTTFSMNVDGWRRIFPAAEKLTIPAYFTTLSMGLSTGYSTSEVTYGTRKIKCEAITLSGGSSTSSYNVFGPLASLEEFSAPNATSAGRVYFHQASKSKSTYGDSLHLEVNFPKIGSLQYFDSGYEGTANFNNMPVFVKLIAPNLTRLGDQNNMTNFRYCYFENTVLPKLTSLYSINLPYSNNSYIRMPRLTAIAGSDYGFNQSGNSNNPGVGVLHLYIGPSLSALGSGVSRIVAAVDTYQRLVFHIPAGDSTTKTTLDNNSIAYVQDYDYEEDL